MTQIQKFPTHLHQTVHTALSSLLARCPLTTWRSTFAGKLTDECLQTKVGSTISNTFQSHSLEKLLFLCLELCGSEFSLKFRCCALTSFAVQAPKYFPCDCISSSQCLCWPWELRTVHAEDFESLAVPKDINSLLANLMYQFKKLQETNGAYAEFLNKMALGSIFTFEKHTRKTKTGEFPSLGASCIASYT